MDDISCSICLIGFEIEENDIDSKPHRLPCAHIFHKPCLEDWFKKMICCPNCRRDFTAENNKSDLIKHDHTITLLLNTIKGLQITNNAKTTETTTIPPSTTQISENIAPKPITATTATTATTTTTTIPPSVTITQTPLYKELERQQQQYYNTTPTNYNRSDDHLLAGLIKDPLLRHQPHPESQPPLYTSPQYELPRVNGSIDSNSTLNSSIRKYMFACSSPIVTTNDQNKSIPTRITSSPHRHILTKQRPPLKNWRCNYCFKHGLGYSEMFQCIDGCIGFALCRYCAKQTNSTTTPEIEELIPTQLSSHPHLLYPMNVDDIYYQGAKCDICRKFINVSAYHCTTCTDFDVCYNCFNYPAANSTTSTTHYPYVTISSSPLPSPSPSLTRSERSEPQRVDHLPDTIRTKYHPRPLTKLQTPLSVYNHQNWNCDVCKKPHNEIWETFYHESQFDLCLDCYFKEN